MLPADRAEQSRQASVRAKVEHPFLIVKRDFGFAKNRHHLHMLFASANWLMRALPETARQAPNPKPPASPGPLSARVRRPGRLSVAGRPRMAC